MADRLSQYPMLSNFSNNMLQQQQLQQQQPSQQHQDSHSILPSGALDQAMIWQQMQMQPQFRPHGTVDMNSPTPAQFADLMKRTQGINRVHGAAQLQLGQQQQQQQQQQQPFALGVGMPQMSSGGSSALGGASQPLPFHDSSSNHAQAPHMPPSFPNMGGMANGNMNASALLQQRRQLGLIAMAQNQQSQNGPGNFNKFNQQQQQFREQQQLREREQQQQHQQQQFQAAAMNHSSPGDIFSSPGMSNEAIRRPSPHPVNIQSTPNMTQGPAPQSGNIVTPASNGGRIVIPLQELSNRAISVRHNITQIEGQMASVSQQINVSRNTPQEAPLMQRLKDLNVELAKSKDYLQKLIGMANYSKQHGGGPIPAQPPWMPHSGAPQSFEQNVQAARSAAGQIQGQQQQQQQQQQPNIIQPSPSLSHTQSQGNQLGFVPPRSGPTPQQQGQPGSQHPPSSFNMPTNAMGTAFSFPSNGTPSTGPGPSPQIQPNRPQGGNLANHFGKVQTLAINPLDKARFDFTYKNFCQRKGLKLDQRLLTIESQPIDLHALHVQVLQEGGSKNVEEKDMWNIIGARMGFVQFHGTGNEPAKSGPGVAQQLAHIYKEYLAQFDGFYVSQTLEQRMKMQQANASFQAQMAAFNWSPQQMQAVIALSHMSLQDLHAQNVPEKMIQFVENHRASLQRAHQDQKNFQRTLRVNPSSSQGGSQTSEQARPSVPGAPGIGPSNSFAGSPAQHNVALTMATRQQFLQHHQQQQQQQQQLQNTALIQGRPPQQGGPQPVLPARPNSQAMAHAESLIAKYKHEYTTSTIPAMQAVDVPVDQRAEYNRILEQLFRQCQDTDQKLAMIYVLLKQDDLLQKMITIICTVQQQRLLLSTSNNQRYIISLDTIRNMASELQRATDMFTNMVHVMMANHRPSHQTPQQQQQQQQQPQQLIHQSQVHQMQQQQIVNNNLLAASNATPDMVPHVRPPVPQQQPPSGTLPQQQQTQNLSSSLRPPLPAPTIKVQRKPQQSSNTAAVSTPSPAAVHSAATPVANAPTPTAVASSPPASKSPKGKASGKPKAATGPTKRRVSRAVPPSVPSVPAEPVQPSPSTSNHTIKRPREDDIPATANGAPGGPGSSVANEPSPPKRVKTEWESAPSDVLRKKNEAIDSIKTEEDANVFLEQMTAELIKMAANGEGQESLSSDISDTLEMILKGYGPIPDTVDISNAMSSGESGTAREPSPPPAPLMDAFDEFFDFSFGTVDDDENNSKAPTPDLVSSSSTNPSPESNHETDATNHTLSSSLSSAMDIKTEEPDPLRLGTWKDIDQGEATYYNPTAEWKWDSPMPSHDQPWAIFNS